jgi:hypothetical protein
MEKSVGQRMGIEKKNFWKKAVASAALLVIFGCVVFSMPSERLAWQAPYVMGGLLLPKPSGGPYVRSDAVKDGADALFSLLGFFSVAGILVLAIRKIPDMPPVGKALRLDRGLQVPIEDKIMIMYIL